MKVGYLIKSKSKIVQKPEPNKSSKTDKSILFKYFNLFRHFSSKMKQDGQIPYKTAYPANFLFNFLN